MTTKDSENPVGASTVGARKRLRQLYLPSDKVFALVDVPDMQFVMIDGAGNPQSEIYAHAMRWLFSVVYPIKRIAKERMGKHFVEPPMEGLWWADDMEDFITGDKDTFKWRMMIVTADWVTDEMFEEAVVRTKARLGEVPGSLRLETYSEGRSAQIMHVGPPSEAVRIMAKLHKEFLPENHLVPNGHHHEIYENGGVKLDHRAAV